MTPEMKAVMNKDVELIELGALDHLTNEEIRKHRPVDGDQTLISRLANGDEIKISKRTLTPLIQDKIYQLESQNVSAIILVCTGSFPSFHHQKPILYPDKIVYKVVEGLLKQNKLGVIVPLPDQVEDMALKWNSKAFITKCVYANPYKNNTESFVSASKKLAEEDVDLIVLDCMGYTESQKEIVKVHVNCPVILSKTIIARVANELL